MLLGLFVLGVLVTLGENDPAALAWLLSDILVPAECPGRPAVLVHPAALNHQTPAVV